MLICIYMYIHQTELGVLTFFPRSRSGRSRKNVASHKNQCFLNENHNFCRTSLLILIFKIVHTQLFSYVCSDFDIDFLMSLKTTGNHKSRWSFLVVQFLQIFIKVMPYSKFCMISFSDSFYNGFGHLEGHFFHTYNEILTCQPFFT